MAARLAVLQSNRGYGGQEEWARPGTGGDRAGPAGLGRRGCGRTPSRWSSFAPPLPVACRTSDSTSFVLPIQLAALRNSLIALSGLAGAALSTPGPRRGTTRPRGGR